MKPCYELLDHTADLAVRFYGESLPELFEVAGITLFSLIGNIEKASPLNEYHFEIEGADLEDLMINWMRELLYKFNGEDIFLSKFRVLILGEKELEAKAWGEPVDYDRHEIKMEIKAVTYHGIKVEKDSSKGRLWMAEVVFDV